MNEECRHEDDLTCNDCDAGKNVVATETYPTIDIHEMFQYMWTVEPEMAYHRHSPEFLRIT